MTDTPTHATTGPEPLTLDEYAGVCDALAWACHRFGPPHPVPPVTGLTDTELDTVRKEAIDNACAAVAGLATIEREFIARTTRKDQQ